MGFLYPLYWVPWRALKEDKIVFSRPSPTNPLERSIYKQRSFEQADNLVQQLRHVGKGFSREGRLAGELLRPTCVFARALLEQLELAVTAIDTQELKLSANESKAVESYRSFHREASVQLEMVEYLLAEEA